ncbi:uncharacterized protein LAESUDRAFT_720508 [Laetiporus sulphureus 93-53]|uniref:Alpha-ketoglutarate-dependent dioxygenase AlkB-like domain-containing protein n=1 Tax=Laetiporus sulphureus 93-53 TaxID=1314785 RepID=A0A165H620_9APHY|nr:uncharacterized protein LAESUDRAFT_720508 [Laetiporus sulphureus 93-53]KZT11293.1 hypothetical protein LAESUDRAFT_720508 [Laetiporus sulphureus 93-53]
MAAFTSSRSASSLRSLIRPALRSLTSQSQFAGHSFSPDFTYYPGFFSLPEQRILLAAALQKLDSAEPRSFRRRRKDLPPKKPLSEISDIREMFLADEYYNFEEGHYDGVIKRFREMHVSSWPSDIEGLPSVIARLQALLPSGNTQTHFLHLASDGEILPHIDNVGASGSWILGISLGATRLLRLESTEDKTEFMIPLPSGSVYLQKDSIRYNYKHSILQRGSVDGSHSDGGQRLSLMIRDRLPPTQLAKLKTAKGPITGQSFLEEEGREAR